MFINEHIQRMNTVFNCVFDKSVLILRFSDIVVVENWRGVTCQVIIVFVSKSARSVFVTGCANFHSVSNQQRVQDWIAGCSKTHEVDCLKPRVGEFNVFSLRFNHIFIYYV